MSSHHRAERRRAARAARRAHDRHGLFGDVGDEDDCGAIVGWFATLEDLEEAKRTLHDSLIRMMGDSRRGPVHWRWWSGDEAQTVLDALIPGSTTEEANHYRRVRAHLREWGGYVIAAFAVGEPPPGRKAR